ncbi:MAG: TonB-dependent receptor [Candidatus Kapabacteria bacterium]|nr:TonB-dependent receptor [Candidatus Kapabacteria bacterium]
MINNQSLRLILFLVIVFRNECLVLSYQNKDTDTLIKKEFPEITVEGKKDNIENVMKYTSSSIISKSQIIEIDPSNLSYILQYQPGIYIRDYGGLGGLKTISMRGTNSMQTLITLEGFRLNSSQTSMFDLNKIPISIIDDIQIFKGGSSSISGSNSIAGVVNLQIKDFIEKDELSLNFEYGSFNEIISSANFSLGGQSQFVGHLDYQHSDGNFPFYSNQFGEVKEFKRENGDYNRFSFYFFRPMGYKSFSVKPMILFSYIERGSPGAVLQGHIESLDARLNELFVLFNLPTDLSISKTSFLKTNLSFKYEKTSYYNPEFSFLSADNKIKFDNNEIQFSSVYLNNFTNEFYFCIGTEFIASELKGNMLDKEIGEKVNRYSIAGFTNFDYQWVASDIIKLSTNLAFRADGVNKIIPNYSFSLGTSANLFNSEITFKALFSNNFRIPSFNEMYYLNYGNSDLKPEKSYNINFGLIFNPRENLNFELSGFLIKTYDQIVSVPLSPLRWSAKNIAETFSRGLELSSNLILFNDLLNIKFNYTLQMITDESSNSYTKGKIIVYTPQELINSTISLKTDIVNTLLGLFYSSHRFYLPENDYNSYLPSYFLINFSLYKDFQIFKNDFRIRIDFENILDRRYEIIRNYPMPGFSFKIGFGMNFSFGDNNYD